MKFLDVPQSGSYQGVTHSRNRFGQYRRTRAIPVNPATSSQTLVRSNFVLYTKAWQQLSAADQLAWVNYAIAHPRLNGLGVSVILTGQQTYVGWNCRLIAGGLPAVTTPPPGGSVPPVDMPEVTDISYSLATGVSMTFTNDGAMTATARISQWATPPKSPGVQFAKDFYLLGTVDNTESSPQVTERYQPKFGAPPLGGVIFFKSVVTDLNGIIYGTQTFRAIVAA